MQTRIYYPMPSLWLMSIIASRIRLDLTGLGRIIMQPPHLAMCGSWLPSEQDTIPDLW
jgi:hypothetical protein